MEAKVITGCIAAGPLKGPEYRDNDRFIQIIGCCEGLNAMRYQLNGNNVVSEVLDGEVIAIHLQTGHYYSMLASAADIWNALLDGWTAEEISDRLMQGTARKHEHIGKDVTQFIAALIDENLILRTDEHAKMRRNEFQPCAPYAAPELQKYTDMQELLLVDPIHEVTEEGWPLRTENDH